MTDLEVIAAVLTGRRDLYAILVQKYQGLVHAVIRSFSPGFVMDEDDFAQEIFIKAYRALAQYRGEASFSTWLYRIAVNHFKDLGRRSGPATVPLAGNEAELTSGGPDPEEQVVTAEDRLLVQTCLAALPEIYRRVIYLYHYRGLSYAEIGARLGLPARSVETRLYRAKRILRAELAKREVRAGCVTP